MEDDLLVYVVYGGGALVILALLLLLRRLRNPTDLFDDVENGDAYSGENGDRKSTGVDFDPAISGRKETQRQHARDAGDCSHHYEIVGFPADRIGTHVIINCGKCGDRCVVSVEESSELLKSRDDVRAALDRARRQRQ